MFTLPSKKDGLAENDYYKYYEKENTIEQIVMRHQLVIARWFAWFIITGHSLSQLIITGHLHNPKES